MAKEELTVRSKSEIYYGMYQKHLPRIVELLNTRLFLDPEFKIGNEIGIPPGGPMPAEIFPDEEPPSGGTEPPPPIPVEEKLGQSALTGVGS